MLPAAKKRRTGLSSAQYSKTVSRHDFEDDEESGEESDAGPGSGLEDGFEASGSDSEQEHQLTVDDLLESKGMEKIRTLKAASFTPKGRKEARADSSPADDPPETKANIARPPAGTRSGNKSEKKPSVTLAAVESVERNGDREEGTSSVAAGTTFADLGLSKWLTDQMSHMSIKAPSEIQAACIPRILQGSDVVGSAKTGSGKTAAFALPILQKLSEDPYGIFALVLTPTRELAFQIAEQFRALGAGMNLRQAVIVGGMDMIKQSLELAKRPHVVVATPGRMVDHLTRSGSPIYLDRLKFLVLDEADRLLETTFADDLEVILSRLPARRQTLLFSATMTKEIGEVQEQSKAGGRKVFVHHCADRFDTVEKLDQRFLIVPNSIRETYLTYLLKEECAGKSVIIFVGKSLTCERLRVMLRELDIASTALHAQMSQAERIAALMKFKSGIISVLLTTDVGSRGLDIPEVEVVINYDISADATDYVHRVGRTARAGRGGRAIAMVTEHDVGLLLNVEKKIGKKLEALMVPENKVLDLLEAVSVAKRVANLHLADLNFGAKRELNAKKERIRAKSAIVPEA
ncbi:P-loop containing nucleoside triphosphate hydrolase protein [Hyaloraphidium curvatum]|nr:P-loop containing nucleoside triphosphate hydrolase protein [Hyaloraphidium curvatum]